MIKLSVIICTYNPDEAILIRVLTALQQQSLGKAYWGLIIVNNNSDFAIPPLNNLEWHNNCQVITETKPGLSYARLAGFKACKPGSLIVFVDDDNVLDKQYLEICLSFYNKNPQVGCFGGRSLPVYQLEPPDWFYNAGINLGCQDFGNEPYLSQYKKSGHKLTEYPQKSPIGTGMAIAYAAFKAYVYSINDDKLKLGRKGSDLTSAEDNDIVLTVIASGFEIAYVPELVVKHIIPPFRLSFAYLKQMAYKSNVSWIKVLQLHHINPHLKIPAWTLKLRQAKAWFTNRAWQNKANYIKWRGACGVFKGLSEI